MPATITAPPALPPDTDLRVTVLVNGVEILERFGVDWRDVATDDGTGEFRLLNDDSQYDDCEVGALVEFQLDGEPICHWILETIDRTDRSVGEEASYFTVFSGSTTMAVLERAIVYTSTGIYSPPEGDPFYGLHIGLSPHGDDRLIGWPEPQHDRSAWGSAVSIEAPLADKRPEGFPDPDADWIWHAAASGGAHVASSGLFAAEFTVPEGHYCRAAHFFMAGRSTADYEVYLDGVLVAKTDPETDLDAGTKAREVVVAINGPGSHTIVARVNHTDPAKKAGFVCTVYEHGTNLVLTRTSTSWEAIDLDDETPMTPGSVFLQVDGEAKARDTTLEVSCTFTATHDSNGDPWEPIIGDFALRVGDSHRDVVHQLQESWVEAAMDPVADGEYELSMWGSPALGDGRGTTTEVVWAAGVNCVEIATQKTIKGMKTVALVRWGDGYGEQTIDALIAEYWRAEGFVGLSNVNNGVSAFWTAYATIAPFAGPAESLIIEIDPEDETSEPYTSCQIGDWVAVKVDEAADEVPYRVAALGGSEDENGYLTFHVELASIRDIFEQQMERWLRRTANGTLDGRSRAATPNSPSILQSGVVPVIEIIMSMPSGEALIGDRGTPYRPREPILIYQLRTEADVAGATDDTTSQLFIDVTGGESVTLPVTLDTGLHDMATPLVATTTNRVNAEVTAEGGHTNINVTALAVALG